MKVVIDFEFGPSSVAATSPDFPNVVGIGDDRDDARRRFLNALEGTIAYHREIGKPLDFPSDDREIVAA